MLSSKDFHFVGAPAWKTVDREVVVKVNRWVKRFQEIESGKHLTLYEPKAVRQVIDWAVANRVAHSITKFRGGGVRIEKL
jgi:hypothetical protein